MSQDHIRNPRAQGAEETAKLLEQIKDCAARLGKTPSRLRFCTLCKVSPRRIERLFESWTAACRAAGLTPFDNNRRVGEDALLADFGAVVRKLGRVPTTLAYIHHGRYSYESFFKRYASWSRVPQRFRKFAATTPGWDDVLALLPPDRPASQQDSAGQYDFGPPLNFPGCPYEPTEELGVIYLFALLSHDLGFVVEKMQTRFPDCIAKRRMPNGAWRNVRIEFEFESRAFKIHAHPIDGCDLIICWRHNWKDCPLEVIELQEMLRGKGSLPPSRPLPSDATSANEHKNRAET